MKKIILILFICFSITNVSSQPVEQKNPDWPCIQVLIEELSWASIWTGPPLNETTAKWSEKEGLQSLVTKAMDRKTKQEDGINEIKKYMNKNNSKEDLTLLFHGLFDTTNKIWKDRVRKLINFGKRQRLTSEEIAKKLEKIRIMLEDPNVDKELLAEIEQERYWDLKRFEDRRNQSDYLCEQPRFYEKRMGVYANLILENF